MVVLKEGGLVRLFENVFPELVAAEGDLFHGMLQTRWMIQHEHDSASHSPQAVIPSRWNRASLGRSSIEG